MVRNARVTNAATYSMVLAVKIPGSELVKARRGGSGYNTTTLACALPTSYHEASLALLALATLKRDTRVVRSTVSGLSGNIQIVTQRRRQPLRSWYRL